jgi:DNA-binding CsgD family transcriptional regulator
VNDANASFFWTTKRLQNGPPGFCRKFRNCLAESSIEPRRADPYSRLRVQDEWNDQEPAMNEAYSRDGGDMHEWARLLSHMSTLSSELYRLALTAPANRFQELALEAAQAVLGFDAACWNQGAPTMDGPNYHSAKHYGSLPDRNDYHESVLNDALANPGRTITAQVEQPGASSANAVAHAHRHKTNDLHAMSALNLFDAIVFCRYRPDTPFSEAERLFIDGLVPQLADTWRINRLRALQGDRRRTAQINESQALCDSKRFLHAAGRHFAELMQLEWRDWCGPQVPTELLRDGSTTHIGNRIVVTVTPANDMWCLSIRKRTRTDRLTARERDIAKRFGRGLGYREVAQELRIAPATARNHLKNIYDKLEINSKVELAGLLRQIERPEMLRGK